MRHLILLSSLLFSTAAFALEPGEHNPVPFDVWLGELRQEAASAGISEATLDDALADIAPIDRIIELDRKQPETTLTFDQYLMRIVSDERVENGRQKFAENKELLTKVSEQFGVQPQFIVALWGIETNYGENTGNYGVVESLATLAYDGRRSEFFRTELMKALKIMDSEHISSLSMSGSWAGAMGQCQFMPSSYLQFAVDFDGDGQRDIWANDADVFASIANYLHESGWNSSEGWGMPVELPESFDRSLADIKQTKTLAQWRQLGLSWSSDETLPDDQDASLAMVGEGDDASYYLVSGNYKVLLKWNRSRYFATSVGILADRIAE